MLSLDILNTLLRLNDSGLSRYVGDVKWDVGEGRAGLMTDDACWRSGVSADVCADGYFKAIQSVQRGIVQLHAEVSTSEDLLRSLLPILALASYKFVRLDAVPRLQTALANSGGKPGTVGGAGGCSEY